MLRHTVTKITAVFLSVLLVACGGGSGSSSPAANTNPTPGGVANSTGASPAGSNTANGSGTPVPSPASSDTASTGSTPTGTGGSSTGSGSPTGSSSSTDTGGSSTNTGTAADSPAGTSTTTTAAFVYDETARFSDPTGIAADGAGNLYVLDHYGTVRKIAANGSVSTVASDFGAGIITAGGVAVDRAGTLYVVMSTGAIYKITPDGTRSVLATVPGATQPALDAQGNLFVLVAGPNLTKLIQRITPAGSVSTVYSGAQNVHYQGLAVDSAGNVYTVASANENSGHGRVVKIAPDGTAIDFTPFDPYIYPGDGGLIANITFDSANNLYIAYHRIHVPSPGGCTQTCTLGFFESGMSIDKISPTGATTRVRTGPPGSTGTLAEYLYDRDYSMSFVTAGIDGNLYVTYRRNNTVYRISQSGEPTLIAGKPGEAGTSD
jgi:sugar lactone lactonase YvrE